MFTEGVHVPDHRGVHDAKTQLSLLPSFLPVARLSISPEPKGANRDVFLLQQGSPLNKRGAGAFLQLLPTTSISIVFPCLRKPVILLEVPARGEKEITEADGGHN